MKGHVIKLLRFRRPRRAVSPSPDEFLEIRPSLKREGFFLPFRRDANGAGWRSGSKNGR
jgi:hypothetical protein